MYSLQDLIDLVNDVLLPEITKIHANFAQHIKTDCEVRQLFILISFYLLSFCQTLLYPP